MLLSSIFAVAIGLFILWVVLSLSTIQIQEWVNTRLSTRARIIEDSIHEMLANPNLKAQFYDHPVIHGLTAKRRKRPSGTSLWFYGLPITHRFSKEERILPSYIPSDRFATALFDIALTAGTESALIQQGILKIRDDLQNETKRTVYQPLIEELNLLAEFARSAAATEAGISITSRTLDLLKDETAQFIEKFHAKYPQLKLDEELEYNLRKGLQAGLEEAARLKDHMDNVLRKQRKDHSGSTLSQIRRGIAALSVISPELSQNLNALMLDVEDLARSEDEEISLARENVEKWFNDTMDRVSGVFKRYSQSLALIIGIYLAVLLNIDAIGLSTYLWREPFIRQVLIENASKFEPSQEVFVTDPKQAMQDFRKQFIGLSLPPIGWVINESKDMAAINDGNCQLFPREGQSFGIPVFYTNKCIAPPESNEETNIFLKLIGILFTALAARQGAPLWFDIMRKLLRPA